MEIKNTAVFDLLIRQGVDVNLAAYGQVCDAALVFVSWCIVIVSSPDYLSTWQQAKTTLLMEVASSNWLGGAERLIARGADVTVPDKVRNFKVRNASAFPSVYAFG